MISPPDREYDEVPYPSQVFPYSHPDRLATIAVLHGMQPVPVDKCRYLELGCGDGRNLISAAFAHPGSEFVGIEIAREPVARARLEIEELGLRNLTIHHCDLLDAPGDLGAFDFIVAHGVYSWVPAAARDKIMSLCADRLTSQGVAYISYHTYPGCHASEMAWKMMRYHVRDLHDPEQRTAQARELLGFLAQSKTEPDLYRQILRQELERVAKRDDRAFYHDDLSAVNDPLFFHEFVEQAARHQLQYLGDARTHSLPGTGYTPETLDILAGLEENIVAWEQYCDFLAARRFRWSLLCRAGIELDRDINPERLFALYAASTLRPASRNPEINSEIVEEFVRRDGGSVKTGHPLAKAALTFLDRARPDPVPFRDLLKGCWTLLDRNPDADSAEMEADAIALAGILIRTFKAGFIRLHVHAPRYARQVSERPLASPIARHQAKTGDVVETLRLSRIRFEDAASRHLLQLLDGTRDRAELRRQMRDALRSGAVEMSQGGVAVPAGDACRLVEEQLEATLEHFAKSAVLLG